MPTGSSPTATGSLVLAIDQGTTNTKALLVDSWSGAVLSTGSAAVAVAHPARGWVEQDAAQLWSSTLTAATRCLDAVPDLTPVAVGVTNQRESAVAWSRASGAPLGPVLGWQDARTAEVCRDLVVAGAGPEVRRLTGLSLDPMFSAPKMRWLLDAAVSARRAIRATSASGRSTRGWCGTSPAERSSRRRPATPPGRCCSTWTALDWAPALLDLFGVCRRRRCPRCAPPTPASASQPRDARPAGRSGRRGDGRLPRRALPARVHEPGHRQGDLRHGFVGHDALPGPDAAPEGIATTLAWLTDRPTFAREGNILASGSALDWMASTLGAPADEPGGASCPGSRRRCRTQRACASSRRSPASARRTGTGGRPACSPGSRAARPAPTSPEPRWRPSPTRSPTSSRQIETRPGPRIDVLHADGGATASRQLMQTQADLLGRPSRGGRLRGVGARRRAPRGPSPHPRPRPPAARGRRRRRSRSRLPVGRRRPTARRRGWRDAVDRSRGRAVAADLDPGRPPSTTRRSPRPPTSLDQEAPWHSPPANARRPFWRRTGTVGGAGGVWSSAPSPPPPGWSRPTTRPWRPRAARLQRRGVRRREYESEVVPAIEARTRWTSSSCYRDRGRPGRRGGAVRAPQRETSPYAYPVSGTGVAGEVRGTLLPLTIEGLPPGVEVVLQIGPAINGTALRDATGLIGFDDFLNQIEYADAATELNNQVKEEVLAGFDAAAAEGKAVSFTGAFAYGSNTALLQVTPGRARGAPRDAPTPRWRVHDGVVMRARDITKVYGGTHALRGRRLRRPRRRGDRAVRRERRRQVDADEDPRRRRDADHRRARARTASRVVLALPGRGGRPRGRDHPPGAQPLPQPSGHRQPVHGPRARPARRSSSTTRAQRRTAAELLDAARGAASTRARRRRRPAARPAAGRRDRPRASPWTRGC